MSILTLKGADWRTPLSGYPDRTVGDARLGTTKYRGLYTMEGTDGYDYYDLKGWAKVRTLQRRDGRRWKTWMVDDPLHWHAMRRWVDALPGGDILVAGLGLGLMLHHMAQRPDIKRITVLELDPDVIALIRPTIPDDPRVNIVQGDFYAHLKRWPALGSPKGDDPRLPKPDAVLWDLAVGGPDDTMGDFFAARTMVGIYLPGTPLFTFGMKLKGDSLDVAF